ncbi:type II 3-dehydroquinate dehydratase [Lentzea nigeriaca]|uniref:type II 3-dehydroquinate dehydratase n=1 Tax=Lentzea nigeriaca TaxID=1128665 RepID=UPI00195CDBD6|nr:type II 3-dehydroquinate dehydratase [Lentzea nigeriaca]MBM7856401.1 3-dehydroquinate dehydratase-2 [Lentzea nigeriaca]
MRHGRLLIMNGPNLNLLGTREPGLYGVDTLADVERIAGGRAEELGYEADFFQSNWEGALIDRLHEARGGTDGVVLNPGAFTHTSVALRDALLATELPVVEVHISNVHKREEFRHRSYISDIAEAVIVGAGIRGYVYGVECLDRALRLHDARSAV